MKKFFIPLLVSVLFLGCVEQELKEITIPGHKHIYQFSYDIKQSLKIPTNDNLGILELISKSNKINIVFNGSSKEDNAYFQVVSINIISKLPTYFAYEGKLLKFDSFYYINDQWYNATNKIGKPIFNETTIWLLGPNTGANQTSLRLENNIIYLQGTSYKNLVLAGDKLALIAMGISSLEDIP